MVEVIVPRSHAFTFVTKISKNILSGLDKNIIGKTSKNNGLNGSINGMGILNVPLSLQIIKNMVFVKKFYIKSGVIEIRFGFSKL